MQKRTLALVLILALSLGFAIPTTAREVHVVERGDALWRIAEAHGLTYTELAAYNHIRNPHRIITGQRIYIPAPAADDTVLALTSYEVVVGATTRWPVGGTLTLPAGAGSRTPVPGVILVHGSGPANRDSLVHGNRPFYDIAAYLTAHGVAVLRYDNRNLVHGWDMQAAYGPAFTVWEETIEAALDAAQIMRQDPRIGEVYILGLSLGAMLAPRIHAAGGDFDGIIMMAGSSRTLMDIILDQEWNIIETAHANAAMQVEFFLMLADAGEYDFLRMLLDETTQALGMGSAFTMTNEEITAATTALVDIMAMQMYTVLQMMEDVEALFAAIPYMSAEEARRTRINPDVALYAYYHRDIALHPTEDFIREADVPFLILQGTHDFQVFAETNLWELYQIFNDRSIATFFVYEGLNHFFMPSTATNFFEAMDEYFIPAHVHPYVLRDIVEWIFAQRGQE